VRKWFPALYGFCVTTAVFVAWIGASNAYEILALDPRLTTAVVDSRLLRACTLFTGCALLGGLAAWLFPGLFRNRMALLACGMARTTGLLFLCLAVVAIAGGQASPVYSGFANTALTQLTALNVVAGAGGFLAPFAPAPRPSRSRIWYVASCAAWLYLLLYWFVARYVAGITHSVVSSAIAAVAVCALVACAAAWLKSGLVHEPVES
jgi:hypothetical protein